MARGGAERKGERLCVAIGALCVGGLMSLLAAQRAVAYFSLVSWGTWSTIAPLPDMTMTQMSEVLAVYREAAKIVPGDSALNQAMTLAALRMAGMSGGSDEAAWAVAAAEAGVENAPSRAHGWSLLALARSLNGDDGAWDVAMPLRLSYSLGPYEAIDYVPRLSAALARWAELPDDLHMPARRDAERLWLTYPNKAIFAALYLDAGLEGRAVLRSVVAAMGERNEVRLDRSVMAVWRERRGPAPARP